MKFLTQLPGLFQSFCLFITTLLASHWAMAHDGVHLTSDINHGHFHIGLIWWVIIAASIISVVLWWRKVKK